MSTSAPARTRKPQQRKKPAPATWYVTVGGNDIWWRVEAPAKAIGAKTCKVPQEDVFAAYMEPNNHTAFPWSLELLDPKGKVHRVNTARRWKTLTNRKQKWVSMNADFPEHEGVAVFTRPNLPQATLAKAMRINGFRTIAESDDNYFSNPNQNLYLRQTNFTEHDALLFAKAMASMDDNIFSTELLRDFFYKAYRERFGKSGLPKMHVCHNNIDIRNWPDRAERDDGAPLRVGFMGSNSHVWDVNLIYGTIKMAKDEGCETHFIGYDPSNPDPNLPEHVYDDDGNEIQTHSEKSLRYRDMWKGAIDKGTRWVESNEYHRAALPLDIGLAPLRMDHFTLGKSDVKAIEYTISGAAVVCANIPVYNRYWKHEETCLMANSPYEFAVQTRRLIRDPKLRYELVTAAQEYVEKERGLKQMKAEWGAVIGC